MIEQCSKQTYVDFEGVVLYVNHLVITMTNKDKYLKRSGLN